MGLRGLPYPGGVESVVEGIVRHLDPEKFQATVYCDSRMVPKGYEIPNVTLIHVPSLPGKHMRAASHFTSSALHALFRGQYDVIHVQSAESAFILPLLRLRYSRVISTSHGQAQARAKWGRVAKTFMALMEYPFVWVSTVVTSVSKPLADYYEERYGRPVHYIPNAVEEQTELPADKVAEALKKHNLEPGYIMFAAARVMPSKGTHTLLEAFREIDNPDARLIIVGDTKLMPDYEKQLRSLADDRVTFIPFISDRDELRGLLQASRLFVFPSTIEAMSMMLLQVGSLGKPMIYSDIPENTAAMPEYGMSFESENVEDLKEKLLFAWQNPEAIQERTRLIQEHVNSEHGWNKIVGQYESLYGQSVQENGNRKGQPQGVS